MFKVECFIDSVKAMLLVIDCKHRLIAKTPRRPVINGAAISNKGEKGNKAEKEDLLEDGDATVRIEDPTMPAVSVFLNIPRQTESFYVNCP